MSARRPDISTIALASAWIELPRLVYVDKESERSEKRGLPILANAMEALISEIDPRTHQIILIGQVPAPNGAPLACVLAERSQLFRRQDPSCPIASDRLDADRIRSHSTPTNGVLARLGNQFPTIRVVLPSTKMCGDRWCPTYVNGEYIYRDNSHIRRNLKPETQRAIAVWLGLPDALATSRPENALLR